MNWYLPEGWRQCTGLRPRSMRWFVRIFLWWCLAWLRRWRAGHIHTWLSRLHVHVHVAAVRQHCWWYEDLVSGRQTDRIPLLQAFSNTIFFIQQCSAVDKTSQYKLFHHSWSELHCLHHLFTVKSRPPGAMPCGHDFVLANIRYEFNKRHFMARSLFDYV